MAKQTRVRDERLHGSPTGRRFKSRSAIRGSVPSRDVFGRRARGIRDFEPKDVVARPLQSLLRAGGRRGDPPPPIDARQH